jgi:predicted transcriptional regulator
MPKPNKITLHTVRERFRPMKFIAKDEDNDELSLTLHSECPADKVKLAYLLASLQSAAGTTENSGSTNPVKPEPEKVGL